MTIQRPPVLTTAELTRLGLAHREIQTQRRAGLLRRVRRGVYAHDDIDDPELSHRRLIEAARTVIDPTNVISHVSAGVLHSLPVRRDELNKVTITRRSTGHGKQNGGLVVRRTRINDDEVTLLDDVPVTTLLRTTTDLLRTTPFERGVMVCDAAMRDGGITKEQLFGSVSRHPLLNGVGRARRVIRFADPRAESPAESLSRVTMAAAGIAPPQLQVDIFDENGEFVARPDFLWEDLRLIGEVDGMAKYSTLLAEGQSPEAALKFRFRRDERLRQLGYWPLHWDYEIAGDRAALGTVIRRGMSHQSRRVAR